MSVRPGDLRHAAQFVDDDTSTLLRQAADHIESLELRIAEEIDGDVSRCIICKGVRDYRRPPVVDVNRDCSECVAWRDGNAC